MVFVCGLEDGFWEGTEGVGAKPEQYRIVVLSDDDDDDDNRKDVMNNVSCIFPFRYFD